MSQFRKLAAGLVAALAVVGLAACAGAPRLAAADAAAVQSGQGAAVALTFRSIMYFESATIRFENLETHQIFEMWGAQPPVYGSPQPGLLALPPGRYRVHSGELKFRHLKEEMPLISDWFREFEVRSGEVVDLGALTLTAVEAYAGTDAGRGVLKMLGQGDVQPAVTHTYVVYSIDGSSAELTRDYLMNESGLGVAPTVRRLQVRLNGAEFERLVYDAYEHHSDGSRPSEAEADARVRRALEAYLDR